MKKSLIFLSICLLAGTIVFWGCKKDNTVLNVTDNASAYKISFQMLNSSDVLINQEALSIDRKFDGKEYNSISISYDQKELSDFLYKQFNIIADGIPVQANLYSNLSVANNEFKTDISSVNAVSVYCLKDNKLYFSVYKNTNGVYNLLGKYTSQTDGFLSNATDFVMYFETNILKITRPCIIDLKNKEIASFKLDSPMNELSIKIKIMMNQKLRDFVKNRLAMKQTATTAPGTGTSCGSCCTGGSPSEECWADSPLSAYICRAHDDPHGCMDEKCDELVKRSPATHEQIEAYNLTLHRTFRDEFLKYSYFGNCYVTYYYSLYNYLSPKINLDFAIETANMLINMNRTVSLLCNPEQNKDEVLLLPEAKESCVRYVTKLKTMNNDVTFQAMTTDILEDISLYSNMKVGEFCSAINYRVSY